MALSVKQGMLPFKQKKLPKAPKKTPKSYIVSPTDKSSQFVTDLKSLPEKNAAAAQWPGYEQRTG